MPSKGFVAETGLDEKHIDIVRGLSLHVQRRNAAAHETQREFARLLLSEKYLNTQVYFDFEGTFEFTYGTSIEKTAAG